MMAFIVPTNAQLVPQVSGGYVITTAPPVDPATGAIPVAPGQTITLDANATVTYSGTSASGVKVTANVYAYLYQGGAQKAESHKAFSRTLDLTTGNSYTVADTMTITVPADAAPGDYLLKIVASASADYMGLTYNQKPVIEKFVVKVISPVAAGATATPTPVPTATPTPSTFGINSSTVTTSSGGNASYKSADVTGTTSSGSSTGSVNVNLTHVPDGSITMHVQSDPDPAAASQFMLAAASSGSDIQDIACVLVVDHPTLANGADIASATITMTASKAWVDAHGGISAIKILRYSDGVGEALETTCTNPGGDPLVFQAFSPNGLSEFALAAVAALPVTAAESAPTGVQVGASVIIGIIAVIVVLLVAIVGVVYVLKQRSKKKKE
ncbi:MAG TPA: hypothetical protein VGJ92_10305 [Methanocella sp.]|jgi:hypothetical protein